MNALITMDPPPISASSASNTDHVGGIKKSLSDCLHRMEAKDSPMASITLGNKLNDLTKPHNTGGMMKVNRVTTESNLDGIGENKPLSSVSVTTSTPSTGPKTTCSVKLVDIGPKISAGGSDNMHSGNARSNATGDSLKRDLLSSSGVSGGELRMGASAASIVKAASTAQPPSVESCTDEPNAKKPRPSLSESSSATAHRMLLKPKDFVDLKRRTASGFKTNEDSSTVNTNKTIDSSTFDNVEEELGRLFGSSSPHKKDNSNNKVTISPVKSSSASSLSSSSSMSSMVTKDSGFAASHRMSSSKQTSGSPSSTSLTTASTTSSSASSSSTSSLNPPCSSSSGSVTITKLSTGSSLSVESKDLKSVLSAGGNRQTTQASSGPHSLQQQHSATGSTPTMSTAAGISPAISSRVGLVENGLNRLKSNIDITAMASNNSANGGSATNQVGEPRGPKQPFQQQHSPGAGDSGAAGGSIRCNKCNVEYSTKEARRLHTCNSILDQHYLSVENAGERTSNSNKSSSPNSPTGLHMTSADRGANENSTSSPPSSFDSASSRSNSPMMDQWGGNGGGGGNGNRKSTSSSSMTSGGSSSSNGSNSSNASSNSVKLIKEKSDKLIIEGRPKLSVTKVSRLESSTSNEGSSAKSKQGPTSSSPALPKFKLSTASLSDSKKYNESASAAEQSGSGGGGGGEKHQRANFNIKTTSKNNFESNNVASYSGKLKIKLGGGSTTIQSEKSSSSDRTSDRSVNHHHNQDGGAAAHGSGSSGGPEGDRGGLAFSFAGKPTYSPSRIEPSNSGGTTVQTKESPRDASNKDSPASQADSGVYSIASSSSPSKGDSAQTAESTSPESPNRDRMTYSEQNYNRDMQWKSGPPQMDPSGKGFSSQQLCAPGGQPSQITAAYMNTSQQSTSGSSGRMGPQHPMGNAGQARPPPGASSSLISPGAQASMASGQSLPRTGSAASGTGSSHDPFTKPSVDAIQMQQAAAAAAQQQMYQQQWAGRVPQYPMGANPHAMGGPGGPVPGSPDLMQRPFSYAGAQNFFLDGDTDPPKRKRGRPRKNPLKEPTATKSS